MNIKKQHIGQNISRIRAYRGMKQWTMGLGMGLSQQEVSQLEKLDAISDALLRQVAHVLDVPVHIIRHFDEQQLLQKINDEGHEGQARSKSCYSQGTNERIAEFYERLIKVLEKEVKKLTARD